MATLSSAGIGSGLNVEVHHHRSDEYRAAASHAAPEPAKQFAVEDICHGHHQGRPLVIADCGQGPDAGDPANPHGSSFRYKANFADSTIATAATGSTAVPGTYSVEVQALAVNQRQALGTTYASGAAALDFGSDSSRT